MTVNDNTKVTEGLGHFFNSFSKKKTFCIEKDGKFIVKKSNRTLEICTNLESAFPSGKPGAASSIFFDNIKFCNTGKILYVGKFVQNKNSNFIAMKGAKAPQRVFQAQYLTANGPQVIHIFSFNSIYGARR